MGRDTVRVIVVKKRVTFLLLLVTTALIASITLSLSGKAYAKVDPVPFREIRLLIERLSSPPVPMPVVVALLMPMILNVLLFLPWGFFMFLLLDTPSRPTHRSYILTLITAAGFSFLVEASQYFLPTRVTDINDIVWNIAGAFLGAIVGHLRKRVRVAFE